MNDAEGQQGGEQLDEETTRQAKERAEEIDRMYEPGARPTAVVPGTNGMVSGTAFADMAEQPSNDERPDTATESDPREERSPG